MLKVIRKIMFVFGMLLIPASWALAAYVTFAVMLCGGLIQLVDGCILISAHNIVIGFCKVLCCGIPGLFIAGLGSIFGCSLIVWSDVE